MTRRRDRIALAAGLVIVLLAGIVVLHSAPRIDRTHVTAYFDNSNGIFVGDDVVVLGVKVGQIDTIEPQPKRAKITFWVDDEYKVPADAGAAILSTKLITSRAIQLTPAYTGGATMADGAVIPQDRTVVPVEFDDFRQQLEKLTESLQPVSPGGVSPLGEIVNAGADNLRGQGSDIRATIIELSQAVSALGDHSTDVFTTVRNLSKLVSALHDNADLMQQLNDNLASVTTLLANDPDEVGRAVEDLNTAVGDVTGFVADNREAVGTTSDKAASITRALTDSLDDVKQNLHVLPTSLQNFINIYDPVHGAISGILSFNNFADPITFLCGAIQSASRLDNEQAAKLCVQYLAPIIKNRQYNFPPIGINPFVGPQARPNELTYSEDWMRPDHRPNPAAAAPGQPPIGPPPEAATPPLAAEAPVSTNPADGLPGLMVPARRGPGVNRKRLWYRVFSVIVALSVGYLSGCGWQGVNSLPLPGTEGGDTGSYLIQAQLPNVTNIQPNTRVRVNDVTVGTVTKIEQQGWHALVTMRLNPDVNLPGNATATVGQTSLLGTLHIELAPPANAPPRGKLHDGSVIELANAGSYPTTEQTLSVASVFLNGGGLGQIQDITTAFGTALTGREDELHRVIGQLDEFITRLNGQKDDILAATDGVNNLASQFADQKPVVDKALRTLPDALAVIAERRNDLTDALDRLGKFSALAADSVDLTKEALVAELDDLGPVLESLANAGPDLTRSLSFLSTYPFPKENITKFVRGDAANITMIIDLTLSRLDSSFLTGTRFEGKLTNLEMQWGRTIGQLPSPYTARNPLTVPYNWDQGP